MNTESAGDIYFKMGNLQAAITAHRQVLDEPSSSVRQKASSYIGLGHIYSTYGEFNIAIEMFQESLNLGKEVLDLPIQALSQSGISNVRFKKGELSIALQMSESSLHLARLCGDQEVIAESLSSNIVILMELKRISEAKGKANQVLSIRRESGDLIGTVSATVNLSTIRLVEGDFTQTEESIDSLFATCVRENFQWGMANILSLKSNINQVKENHKESIKYGRQAIDIYEEIGDKFSLANSLANLVKPLLMMGELRSAETNLAKSSNILGEIGSLKEEARILSEWGTILFNKSEYSEAEKRFQQAKTSRTPLDLYEEMASDTAWIAGCRQRVGDFEGELRLLLEVQEIFAKRGEIPPRSWNISGRISECTGRLVSGQQSYSATGSAIRGLLNNIFGRRITFSCILLLLGLTANLEPVAYIFPIVVFLLMGMNPRSRGSYDIGEGGGMRWRKTLPGWNILIIFAWMSVFIGIIPEVF